MYQDAINTLLSLMDTKPGVFKIGIVDKDHFSVEWTDEDFHEEIFESVDEMLKWFEKKTD